jgi:calpain-7
VKWCTLSRFGRCSKTTSAFAHCCRPWPCDYGPKKDDYNLGYNPQFSLFTHVKGSRPCGIWLLLSKHITMTEENRDFITLHVFDAQRQIQPSPSLMDASPSSIAPDSFSASSKQALQSRGTRIYYEGNSLIKGMYVNSPHILVRFEVPPGHSEYTIVLSQHLKTRDLHFTLRAYAVCEFELREIPNKYKMERKVSIYLPHVSSSGVMETFSRFSFVVGCRSRIVG